MASWKELEADIFHALKVETRKRKFRLSPEQDMYRKDGPNFYRVFYWFAGMKDGQARFYFDVTIKPCAFDELQYSIIHPKGGHHFTDKIRTTGGMECKAEQPRIAAEFPFTENPSKADFAALAKTVMDYVCGYIKDFMDTAEREYGDLNGYFIAFEDENPRLAGLACLNRKDIEGAIRCFSNPNIDGRDEKWLVEIKEDDERARTTANGIPEDIPSFLRSRAEQFADFAVCLKKGLKWNTERAMYGLLPEERD